MEAWGRIQAFAALLLQQFGLLGVILGVTGLIVFGRRSRLYLLTIWTAGVFLALAIFYQAPDSDVYLIPIVLCFALWIGLGVGGLIDQLRGQPALLRFGLGLLVLGSLLLRSVAFASQVDASNDHRAEAFGKEILSAAPADAIVFAKGDQAVFTLWYFHFALAERPDLIIVASDLLHFDWYQENLRTTYPSLVVPGPFPWPETLARANPSRAVCYVQSLEASELSCSQ